MVSSLALLQHRGQRKNQGTSVHLFLNPDMPCTQCVLILLQYDYASELYITRSGSATPSNMVHIHNDQVFQGQENKMTLYRVYTTSFVCVFDLVMFPFDVQKCSMVFVLLVGKA